MQVHVLGAGCDVGRSCMLLKTASAQVLLDCGAHPGYDDARRFPDFASLGPSLHSLDAVLVSHFHLDHAAALPLLTEKLHSRAPVYMTAPTRDLARLMLHDFLATSAARRQHAPFDARDVRACLDRVVVLHLGQTTAVRPGLDVTPYYAGHVLGAVMLHVQVDGLSVLYSGDYSMQSDGHLNAADVPYGLCPHLFITEATYCSNVRHEQVDEDDAVMNAVTQAVAKGGKILVPISAFGRVQSVCAALAAHPDSDLLRHVPLYIVSGLASKANEIYAKYGEWTARHDDDADGCEHSQPVGEVGGDQPSSSTCPLLSRLKPFNRNEHWDLLQARGTMILFATPGTMSTGLSRDVFRLWSGDPKNVLVAPAASFSNTVNLLPDSLAIDANQAQVACRLVNLPFNSHADAEGLVRMCRTVQPRSIMLVHGTEEKILTFKKQLSEAFQIDCFAPKNGENISIPAARPNHHVWSGVEEPCLDEVPSDWQILITSYLKDICGT